MNGCYDELKLQNQLCFPLYACAKEVVKKYKPLLNKFDLTYTQYITMLVLWENKEMNVKELGECLYLDSGTLTPLLKKLEAKNYIYRKRDKEDERNLIIQLTENGLNLKEQVKEVPLEISKCVNLTNKEAEELYRLLYKILKKEN